MKIQAGIFLVCASTLSTSAQCDDWKFGAQLSYISGINDVRDLYKSNLRYEHSADIEEEESLPIGLGFRSVYHSDNGARIDLSVGPFAIIFGDVDHVELPIAGSIGYNFNPSGTITPYVRAGLAYHFINGDYVEDSDVGLIGAVGIEFGHGKRFSWGLELAIDTTTVEFEELGAYEDGYTEIETYDTIASAYFTF